MVIILSFGLMNDANAFNVVVFPELVPPDIIALADLTPSPSKHSHKNAVDEESSYQYKIRMVQSASESLRARMSASSEI